MLIKGTTQSLKSTLTFRVTHLKVVGDSKLVISQVVGEWKTRDSKWIPYQELAERLVSLFDEVVFVHVPRDKKSLADAIATLHSRDAFVLVNGITRC